MVTATAQDLCTGMREVLREAPNEFEALRGPVIDGSFSQSIDVFEGRIQFASSGTCVVAQQNFNGTRFSTGYTCASVSENSGEGVAALQSELRDCFGIETWLPQSEAGLPLTANYGLIRFSITGSTKSLALGVEVFRDEKGRVLGSPLREDAPTDGDPVQCSPKSANEIVDLFSMYGERPGAEPFEDSLFVGYINSTSRPLVVFTTRPNHPAHPAIITRDVFEEDGTVYTSVKGDFAGDCMAFHELLEEVREMNQNVAE